MHTNHQPKMAAPITEEELALLLGALSLARRHGISLATGTEELPRYGSGNSAGPATPVAPLPAQGRAAAHSSRPVRECRSRGPVSYKTDRKPPSGPRPGSMCGSPCISKAGPCGYAHWKCPWLDHAYFRSGRGSRIDLQPCPVHRRKLASQCDQCTQ